MTSDSIVRKFRGNGYTAAILTAIIGVIVSAVLFSLVGHGTAYIAETDFENSGEDVQTDLQFGIDGYIKSLSPIRAFLEISNMNIGQAEFWHVAETMRHTYPGSLDFSRVPRVTKAERPAFEARMRAQGRDNFQIWERGATAGKTTPAGERDEYFPTLTTENFSGSSSADGNDGTADPIRRQLLARARDNNELVSSQPHLLIVGGLGFNVWNPVYRFGSPIDTLDDRRKNLIGYAGVAIRIGDMIESILKSLTETPLNIYVTDPNAAPSDHLIYWRPSHSRQASAEVPTETDLRSGVHWEGAITIAHQQWNILVTPSAPLGGGLLAWEALSVLAISLVLTTMIVGYLLMSQRRARQLELVTENLHQMAADLTLESEQRLITNRELERRDDILNAVTGGATDLIEARDPTTVMQKVLERVAWAAGVNRAFLLGNRHLRDGRLVAWERHEWYDPDLAPAFNRSILDRVDPQGPGLARWKILLDDSRSISAVVSDLPEGERKVLKDTGLHSIIVMPITIDGRWWGEIGLGDHATDRVWSTAETDALHTLAELIGSALTQAQYVKELTDANTIVENSPTILFRLAGEPSLPMMYISHNIVRFGHDPAKFLSTPGWYASLAHPQDREKLQSAIARVLTKDAEGSTVEFRLRMGTGAYRWVENRFTPVRDNAGRLIEVEGIISDITERKAAAEKIELLARSDPLTGLANRATFNERLGYVFSGAKRGGIGFAVHYLDLDHFKDINDTLGHPMGDRLLMAVTERLRNNVRETDLLARLGGDEFAVLQTDVSDPSVAGVLAAKIHDVLSAPFLLDGNDIRVTASIGIALYGADVGSPDAMLAQADLALYRAKEEGRDRYSFHSEDLDEQVRERVTIAEGLKAAIDKNELELYYQPQVELVSGLIVGMEALVRWNHPSRGVLRPAAFLPIAEKTGTILPLGRWVIEHACQQMKLWRDAGVAPQVIAVNLSLAQLKNGDECIHDISEALKKWDLAPTDLELDVTESMLAQVTWTQNNMLERLRQLGVRIALDDFGGEYSSFDYVRKYQIDHLKIAQPLVDRAMQEPDRAAAISAIMGLGRALGIGVIAAGVETEEQRVLLSSMGSHSEAQGFYFSEPVPADRALALLRQGKLRPTETETLTAA